MPALRAAEGNVDDGGLPGHETRQGYGVVLVHRGVIAQASLVGTTAVVVLRAIADVVVDRPVRTLEREFRLHDAVGRQENRTQLRLEVEEICGFVEVAVTGFEQDSSSSDACDQG